MLSNLRFKSRIKLFNEIYHDIDGFSVSKETRENLNVHHDESLTYGEVEFMSFKEIIELANPRQNDIFYDLGAGTGKAVIIAAMCFDFSACKGIELLEPVFQLSCQALDNLKIKVNQDKNRILRAIKHLPEIKFYNQNFIKADFSRANIIFINATCYPIDFWNELIQKFNKLADGTRIIITSKKIDSPLFKQIYSGSHLMSWGMNSVRIYQKT
jgi:precorrin-6B methylase 2